MMTKLEYKVEQVKLEKKTGCASLMHGQASRRAKRASRTKTYCRNVHSSHCSSFGNLGSFRNLDDGHSPIIVVVKMNRNVQFLCIRIIAYFAGRRRKPVTNRRPSPVGSTPTMCDFASEVHAPAFTPSFAKSQGCHGGDCLIIKVETFGIRRDAFLSCFFK